ncbi:MAG TPA: VWA domain-containing protein [Candidatus Eisenbacteria bacterium]|nr:VWA domain-containing protein [Candidatus Eisenbacteria bacterium]
MPSPRDLTRAMLAFGGVLRASGLPVTTPELMDAVRALEVVDLMDRDEVYLALRTVLVSRMEEQPAFDRCFESFWKFQAEDGQGLDGLVSLTPPTLPDNEHGGNPPDAGQEKQAQIALDDWDEGEGSDDEPLEVPGLSNREVLMEQDFSTFPAEQLDEVARLTVLIAKRLARRVSRRRKPTRRGGIVDLRRSMRANLMKGEIIELRRRARRRRKVRLVLLCDVSGSMDLYSRFLLQFLYALQNVFGRVETFTFATRLTRVSDLLRGPSYKGALRRLTEVRDWSGGTRIGEAIRDFNQEWGRLVDRRTIVLILSDGWDTGEPDVLAQEMLTLKRRAGRVLWLNPLLGNPSYEPLTRGMAAALPLVDHFAAAHNLSSLRELATHLTLR